MEAKLWEELYSISRRRADLIQSHRAALSLGGPLSGQPIGRRCSMDCFEAGTGCTGTRGRSDELLSDSFENILRVIWLRKRGLNLGIPLWILPRTPPETEGSDIALQRLTEQLSEGWATGGQELNQPNRSWRGKSSRRVVLELSQPR